MNKLIEVFTFRFVWAYVHFYLFICKLIKKDWKEVQSVYLPLNRSIGFNTLRWIVNGKYEYGEIEIIKQKIKEGDRVLEIGTGLGFISTYCSKVTGGANVFSFEANPLNVEIAKKVYSKNNVKPILQHAFLAGEDGYFSFPINRKSRLASSANLNTTEYVEVRQLTLNNVITELKPDFLIMDIEGGEYEIFKLIQFQSIKKIQVELHPAILGQKKMNEIFNILEEHGFVQEIVMPDGRNYFFEKAL